MDSDGLERREIIFILTSYIPQWNPDPYTDDFIGGLSMIFNDIRRLASFHVTSQKIMVENRKSTGQKVKTVL